ncbi:MAG: amino acid adenylation domain-containing protein [Calditrichaeota bacterium]|nr:MAG: amino acid adenylation domain-containing protein [Calditrichota bacterium]
MNNQADEISRLSPEKRKLLEKILQQQNIDLYKKAILPVSRERGRFPLSYAQQRMWFLDQWQPGNPMYNNPAAVVIKGEIDVQAMQQTLNALSRRHEVLRTCFDNEDGNPVQTIKAESTIQLQYLDIFAMPEEERQPLMRRELDEEAQAPFDLSTGPLVRTKLIRTGSDEHIFLLTMHHIVSDAWTLTLFIKEFADFYQSFTSAKQPQLPELPLHYVDYAVWQRNYLTGSVLEQQLDYWKSVLAEADEPLNFPTDHPRPKMQTFNGDVFYFQIDGTTVRALETASRQQDATLFMTLLTALDVLLFKYTGQEDIRIGTPIANRNRSEVESMLGVFVNTLVMRGDLSGMPTFAGLLQRVKGNAVGAFAHQDIPFEMLVEELKPERDTSRPPFFQVMFVMQNAPSQSLNMANVVLTPQPLHTPTAKFDLTFVMEPKDGLIDGQIVYNTDLFEKSTIERLAEHLRNLLVEIGKNINVKIPQISLLSEGEKNELLVNRNNASHRTVNIDHMIHERIAESAQRHPNARIFCGSTETSLVHLDRRANQMAHFLLESGITSESIVGIHLPRTLDLLTAMLAVFKAGGVCLPLDPDYPTERLSYMIADSHAALILSHSSVAGDISDPEAPIYNLDALKVRLSQLPEMAPETTVVGENGAYIIYTSGSTGRPKGVVIPHAAFVQHCQGMRDFYQLSSLDRVLQFASTNFDAALEQIFPTMLAGADLVMRDSTVWTPQELFQIILRHKLTVINLPTAYWNQFMIEWSRMHKAVKTELRLIIVGGDLMTSDSLHGWEASSLGTARLLNAYGPTETTITATIYDIPRSTQVDLDKGAIPIGSAVLERSLYILDSHGNPTPVGASGELYIGGFALARGYLHRPDLTAEKFVPNPFHGNGERLYRTGDLVRYNFRGDIEFLGRVDTQVKIRGYRIELGEIEAELSRYPGVCEVVVSAYADVSAEKYLVAYYVHENNIAAETKELRAFLGQTLPDYMIPSVFMMLESMPLAPSGKIDRRALPAPDQNRQTARAEFVAPRTETEIKIAEIVSAVLRVERVGVYDNFFDLGGHSMLGTQVISRLRDVFHVEVSLRELFESPTVEGLTRAIATAQAESFQGEDLEAMLMELQTLSDEQIKQQLNS